MRVPVPSDLATIDPAFETRSRVLSGYAGALFVSPELRHYEIAGALPAVVTADPVPEPVRKAAGWTLDDSRAPGAYPGRVRR